MTITSRLPWHTFFLLLTARFSRRFPSADIKSVCAVHTSNESKSHMKFLEYVNKMKRVDIPGRLWGSAEGKWSKKKNENINKLQLTHEVVTAVTPGPRGHDHRFPPAHVNGHVARESGHAKPRLGSSHCVGMQHCAGVHGHRGHHGHARNQGCVGGRVHHVPRARAHNSDRAGARGRRGRHAHVRGPRVRVRGLHVNAREIPPRHANARGRLRLVLHRQGRKISY